MSARGRGGGGEMRQSETEITLEQYLHFYDHPRSVNLSRFHLNQIIYMHGFMKLHRLLKRNLMEILEAIELAPPRRSTLGRGGSARAPLTAAEAAEDVAALGWQECPIQYISRLESPVDEELLAAPSSAAAAEAPKLRPRRGGGEGSCRAPPPADFVVMGRRPRSKRKRGSINALTAAASATGAGSSSSMASSAPPPAPSSPFSSAPLSPSPF